MKPFAFHKPATAAEAMSRKNNTTQFVAGGTNLLDLMKKHIAQPDTLLDVATALPTTIQLTHKGLRIGAMAKNSALTIDKNVLAQYPLLSKAVLAGASPQIRNMASAAGNLLQRTRCPYFYDLTTPCNKRNPGTGCSAMGGSNRMHAITGWNEQCVAVHPSDFCVALAALDATVAITDKRNNKLVIPFKDFHTLPGNTPDKDNNLPADALIHYIDVPANTFNKHTAYVKLRDRDSYAFALVSVAAALDIKNNRIAKARLASGGVAHKPWRWYAAEQFLKGKLPDAATFAKAAELVIKEVKPLANNQFKVPMLQGAIATALQHCLTA
jgi:xanthine dehydrogenase YagS FAD-binding subunit